MSKQVKTALKWAAWGACLGLAAYTGMLTWMCASVCIRLPKSEPYLGLERLQELQFKWGLSAAVYGLACLALLLITIYLFRRFRKKETACVPND